MSTGVIVGIVLTVFVGTQIYRVFFANQAATPVDTTVIFIANKITPITVDQSFTAQSLINSAQSGAPGVVEYTLQNSTGEQLPAALTLDIVTDDFPITIQQFGTEVHFISIDQARPQVLIRIVDTVSVRGALLVHEDAVVTAMAPLFGQFAPGTFMDETINTTDVRTLTTTAGEQSLTYGFITDTTLLIAGSPTEFETVLRSAR